MNDLFGEREREGGAELLLCVECKGLVDPREIVHGHCPTYACSVGCVECRDEFEAIGGRSVKDNCPVVALTAGDLEIVEREARYRNDFKQAAGVRSCKKISRYSELEANVLGIRGEVAVHRFFGIPFPERKGPRLFGDGGRGDILFPSGKTGQIKTPQQYGAPFGGFWSIREGFKDDFGILVYPVGGASYTLGGYLPRSLWIQVAYQRDFGYGLHWVADWAEFLPIRDLLREMKCNGKTEGGGEDA